MRRARIILSILLFGISWLAFADSSQLMYKAQREDAKWYVTGQAACDQFVYPHAQGSPITFINRYPDKESYCGYGPNNNYVAIWIAVHFMCWDGSNPDVNRPQSQQCPVQCPVGQAGSSCTPQKSNGPPPQCPIPAGTPNPIHAGTGNKFHSEIDYQSSLASNLRFERFYNSQNTAVVGTFSTAWRHNYDVSIKTDLTLNGVPVVFVVRADGNAYSFVKNGTTYQSQDADINDQLAEIIDGNGKRIGWTYLLVRDGTRENYTANGKLDSIVDRRGIKQLLTYSDATTSTSIAPQAGLLIRVTDSFNNALNFSYNAYARISTMTDPTGAMYAYTYDKSNNLKSVSYPGSKSRVYHYNEEGYTSGSNSPNALTGITDENGIRYAHYYYNAEGKAVAEQHAGGVDKYQVSYSSDGSSSTITDPLGAARVTSFTTILGVPKA